MPRSSKPRILVNRVEITSLKTAPIREAHPGSAARRLRGCAAVRLPRACRPGEVPDLHRRSRRGRGGNLGEMVEEKNRELKQSDVAGQIPEESQTPTIADTPSLPSESEMSGLKKLMDSAIEEENYEEAARIRTRSGPGKHLKGAHAFCNSFSRDRTMSTEMMITPPTRKMTYSRVTRARKLPSGRQAASSRWSASRETPTPSAKPVLQHLLHDHRDRNEIPVSKERKLRLCRRKTAAFRMDPPIYSGPIVVPTNSRPARISARLRRFLPRRRSPGCPTARRRARRWDRTACSSRLHSSRRSRASPSRSGGRPASPPGSSSGHPNRPCDVGEVDHGTGGEAPGQHDGVIVGGKARLPARGNEDSPCEHGDGRRVGDQVSTHHARSTRRRSSPFTRVAATPTQSRSSLRSRGLTSRSAAW